MSSTTHFHPMPAADPRLSAQPDYDLPNRVEDGGHDAEPTGTSRIRIVDPTPATHEDFRKILVTERQQQSDGPESETLFDEGQGCAMSRLGDLDRIVKIRTKVINQLDSELRCVNQTLSEEMALRSHAQARLTALSSLGRRLNGARTVRDIGQIVMEAAFQLLGWDSCRVDLYTPSTQKLTHVLSADLVEGRRREVTPDNIDEAPSPLARKAIIEGGQLVDQEEPLNRWSRPANRPFRANLCVPISNGQGVTGVLSIQSYDSNAYDQSSLEILQALADHCGGALDRIDSRRQTDRRAEESTNGARDERPDARLEQAQQQLAAVSRQAGLAEVATGVLHNVGNVLNSVNVAVNVLAETLHSSKAPNLAATSALLNANASDLGRFVVEDPRGRQLPRYLEHLASAWAATNAALSSELASLTKKVDHIKNIVATQQTYAKVLGTVEKVSARDLVEDALKLNASTLQRHDVQVVREYDSHDPLVTVDRHRVLQVLVNLIGNAKHACDESGRPDKQLTVRVTNGGDLVRISVEDNGIGISRESLPRIFTLGFTTRKEGHGFGLHTCALAAREMGGSLVVQSDGPGQGAIFRLELPLFPQN